MHMRRTRYIRAVIGILSLGGVLLAAPVYAYVAPTINYFYSSPTQILRGQGSTLYYSSSNGSQSITSASITGYGGVGAPGASAVAVYPTNSYTYVFNISDGITPRTANAAVYVTWCTLSASPTATVSGGGSTLTWSSDYISSASITPTVGSVGGSGSYAVYPTVSTTYTGAFVGPAGTYYCTATVTVTSCTMSVSPTSITDGASATLTWTSANASSASINQGIGSVAVSGSRTVTPSVTTTYTGTFTGSPGSTQCSATLTVGASTYETTLTNAVAALKEFSVIGSISKAAGSFVIDHPLDPIGKLLYHSFVESPDAKNLYDGVVTLDSKGEAVVTLPSYFEALNKDFRYQIKSIGTPQPDLHVKEEIVDNAFVIGGGVPDGRVSWQVTGTRRDAYIEANPIVTEVDKGPGQPVMDGEYIFPDGYIRWWSPSRIWGSLTGWLRD